VTGAPLSPARFAPTDMRKLNIRRAILTEQGRDQAIKTLFPGWAARRARARMLTQRYEVAAASYGLLRASIQRRRRRGPARSEASASDMDVSELREWSRDTYRLNSLYSGIIRRAVDNWLGGGLTVVPQTGDRGRDADLERAFAEYCTASGGFDAAQRYSFGQWQRVVAISLLRDGDALLYRSDDGWQIFEAGQVGTPRGYSGRRIVSGIEVDQRGRAVRYWVAPYSRHGYVDMRAARGLRADLCSLVLSPEWASGLRGIPPLANALNRFEDLDGYLEAELFTARAASSIMGEFHTDAPNGIDALSATNQSADQKKEGQPRVLEFAPAQWIQTFDNEEIKLHSVNRPASAFGDFVRTMLRLCGSSIGMPLELAVFDLTDTNFAGARMVLLQAWRTFEVYQKIIAEMVVAPVYHDWLERQTEVKVDAEDPAIRRFEIHRPKYVWIDPYKEARAQQTALESGYETLTHIARDMQREVEDLLRERAREIVMAKAIAEENGIDDWRDVLRNVGKWRRDAEPEDLEDRE